MSYNSYKKKLGKKSLKLEKRIVSGVEKPYYAKKRAFP